MISHRKVLMSFLGEKEGVSIGYYTTSNNDGYLIHIKRRTILSFFSQLIERLIEKKKNPYMIFNDLEMHYNRVTGSYFSKH